MAGYIGTKAVNLSTTGADINGNANVDGTLDVTGSVTAGDVNITGPSPVLTLTDDDTASEYTRIENSSGATFITSRNGAGNGAIILSGQGGGVTDEYARFISSGNFGIGDTNPAEALSVTGNITATGNVTANDMFITGATPVLRLTDTDGTDEYTNIANINGSTRIDSRDGAANGTIVFRGFGGGVLDEYARFDITGQLGIGTLSPSAVLDLGAGTSGRGLCWGNSASAVYSNIWSSYSSARTTIGNGLRGSTSVSSGFESSVSSSWAKSAMSVGTGIVQFYTDAASTVAVGTAVTPTERMRINANGAITLGGGTGATQGSLSIYPNYSTGSGNFVAPTPMSYHNRAGSASVGTACLFQDNGGTVGSITYTNTSTSYFTTSDYRLKENITPIEGAGDIVKAMRPATYNFIGDGQWHDGFIADELQELHPRLVSGTKDSMVDEEYEVTPAVEATYDAEGVELTPAVPSVMGTRSVPDYQQVDYSKLTPILTAALKEALTKIEVLEAQNATFETRLAALEATP